MLAGFFEPFADLARGKVERLHLLEVLGRESSKLGQLGRFDLALVAHEEDLALQPSTVLIEVVLGFDLRLDRLAANGTVRAGCPSLGQRHQRRLAWLQHVDGGPTEGPAPPEGPPLLEVPVLQPPLLQFLECPFIGLDQSRRAGQPGTDPVGEVLQGIHHLRVVDAFVSNAVDHFPMNRLIGPQGAGEQKAGGGEKSEAPSHGVLPVLSGGASVSNLERVTGGSLSHRSRLKRVSGRLLDPDSESG